ncbi:type III pantothenate kinase, partial [Flavonifractor plautii]|uniref:type III pantothenate kinase n=1 Tax=Flavonifractor plautii TaxID=292800 RepID=UPI00210DFD76|nr:type III pantothenate kinase [Flavonifractor plautii]
MVGSVYEGCIIMPGLALALDALSERAAALPPISIETASPVGHYEPLVGVALGYAALERPVAPERTDAG